MKKILCIFLSVIMIFSTAIVSFAEDTTTNEDIDTPLIVVRGIDFQGLYVDDGNGGKKSCLTAPTTSDIVKVVFKVLGKYLLTRSLDVDSVIDFVNNMMGDYACDKNGNSVLDVTYDIYPEPIANETRLHEIYVGAATCEYGIAKTAVEYYGEKAYFFTYDWRLDQRDSAAQLNELIENVKTYHNAQKVDIVCCSMGGMVTNFYLYNYGFDSVDTIVFNSSTFTGTYLSGDLLRGKVSTSGDMLKNFVYDMTGKKILVNIIDKLGLFDFVAKLANKIIVDYKDRIYQDVLMDTFCTMPALWALIQPEVYGECLDYIFPTEESRSEYAGLIERVNAIQASVVNFEDMILSLPENGVKVAVVASYGRQMIPIYDSAVYQSDGTLESDFMLGGAVTSITGEVLPEDYIPNDATKLSPDRCVDLSNVLFPDFTWAIKNGHHVVGQYGTDSADLIFKILLSDTQPTVESFAEYPQFLTAVEEGKLVPTK